MPVRKIPKCYRSVPGQHWSAKNGRSIACESTLEADFYLYLEFEDDVENYEEQPLRILYNGEGQTQHYTPDCLVVYKEGSGKIPTIVEAKYASELKDEEKAKELKPKFDAAKEYAAKHVMEFRVVTEEDIRGEYLENLKLIYRFAKPPARLAEYEESIIDALRKTQPVSIPGLLAQLTDSRLQKAKLMPHIWHMMFRKAIKADLSRKISGQTLLHLGRA